MLNYRQEILTMLFIVCQSFRYIWLVILYQICQKRSYTCTVSRHTFHRHMLATSMHQQHMYLMLLKVEQSAFTRDFLKPSGVHAELEIAVGHWPFSDQFSPFGRANLICYAKFTVHFQWGNH